MEFSRQESWNELSFPSPGDLPNPGIYPGFPTLQADSLPSELPRKPMGCGKHFVFSQEVKHGFSTVWGISTLNLHVVQVLVAQLCPTLATPWTVAHQAPLSMEFSRQEYWNGLLFPFPGDLPDPGIEYRSPTLQADSLPSELPRKPP